MNSIINSLKYEVLRIANYLDEISLEDKNGIYWTNSERFGLANNIYAGNAGTLFFLIELFKYTKDENLLVRIKKAANRICDTTATGGMDFSLFTGYSGISLVLFESYELTKNRKFYLKAIELTQNVKVDNITIADLMSGLAGTIMGLIHVHKYTNDLTILHKIIKISERLLTKTRVRNNRLFWDQVPTDIYPLCGLAHGTSGVGFVFQELALYLNNPKFLWLVSESFRYENQHFNVKLRNWPDFRMSRFTDEIKLMHETKYHLNDRKYFRTPQDFVGWCHGAPGIGFSRLRHIELNPSSKFRKDIVLAANKAIAHFHKNKINHNYSLCHGHGGNGLFLLKAYQILGENKYYQAAISIAESAINQYKIKSRYLPGYTDENVENSLFLGVSGIAYFYLKLLNKNTGFNILYPVISQGPVKLDIIDPKPSVYNSVFPKTIHAINQLFPKENLPYKASNPKTFENALRKNVLRLKSSKVRSVFKFELLKNNLHDNIFSYSYLALDKEINLNKFRKLKLTNTNLSNKSFNLKPGLKVLKYSFDLDSLENGDSFYLLEATALGIIIHKINYLVYSIISAIIKNGNCSSIIYTFEPADRKCAKQTINRQLKELLSADLIRWKFGKQ